MLNRDSVRLAASAGSSCSQILIGNQAASCSRASVSASRCRFRSKSLPHQAAFAFGFKECIGQLCQKQPSTKIATRLAVKTMSALSHQAKLTVL